MRIAERALAYLAPACGIRCERLTENQQPTDLGAAELQEKLGRHFGKQQRSLDYFGTAFYIGFEKPIRSFSGFNSRILYRVLQ